MSGVWQSNLQELLIRTGDSDRGRLVCCRSRTRYLVALTLD